MNGYQGFAISNTRTGFNESLEPWLLPRDGWQSLINCHLYRGVVEKTAGYLLYARMSQRQIQAFDQAPDGVRVVFTTTLNPRPPTSSNILIYATPTRIISTYVSYNAGTNTVTYTDASGTATINLTTGLVTVTFVSAPPAGLYSSVFIEYDSAPAVTTSIMGIKQYYTAQGGQDILVFDQLRVGKIVNNVGQFNINSGALQAISQLPAEFYTSKVIIGNGTVGPYVGVLPAGSFPLERNSVVFTEYLASGALPTPSAAARVVTDNGSGVLQGTGVTAGSINYVTGAFTVTFAAPVAVGNYFDSSVGVFGNLFTGGISNFFSLVNYQYKAFFTNGIDPVFYYDGSSVKYLNTNLSVKVVTAVAGIPPYDISTALHLDVNQQRLLLISVIVQGVMQVSTVYWSRVLDPLDFTNDEHLTADTSERIRAIGKINTDLIIRFANSERVFRYTGDPTSPFRFDQTNGIWACDAPYSTINYDTWFSTVGRPAIVGSDGVNVRRVDDSIPDFTDPSRINDQIPVPFMSQTSIKQCYGERFDDIKEGWLCYNSSQVGQTVVQTSNNILSFQYLDSTYAVYDFPLTCLGFGRIINVPTWGTITTKWEDMEDTWDSYELTSDALLDLGGDAFDKVYKLNTGSTKGDGITPVKMSAITKNFNPFIEEGQLCRLGYIDIFVSADQLSVLRVQFYVNDQMYIDPNNQPNGFYQESILRFTPTDAMSQTTSQVKVWKRVYVGSVGKEHTIRFYQNDADFTPNTLGQPVFIHAIVPYFKPAGRIFN